MTAMLTRPADLASAAPCIRPGASAGSAAAGVSG